MLEKKSTYIHALSAHAKGGRRLIVLSLSLFAYSISPHYPGHSEAICELAHAGEKDATFDRNHSSTEYDRWLHVSKKSWLVPVQNKDVRPHICTLRMRVRRARVYTHTHTPGPIPPAYQAIQSRWKQIRGEEYRDNLEDQPAGRLSAEAEIGHKHDLHRPQAPLPPSFPTERDRPPTASERLNEIRVTRSKKKVVGDSEESVGPLLEPWRPIGYHRGGCLLKTSPFTSPSAYPQAPWSVRGNDLWVLKPKEIVAEEKKPHTPKWVPAGTHKLETQWLWSEDLHRFERKLLRQWSTLE